MYLPEDELKYRFVWLFAGRGRDPVRTGAFGASQKPAHSGAKENPQ